MDTKPFYFKSGEDGGAVKMLRLCITPGLGLSLELPQEYSFLSPYKKLALLHLNKMTFSLSEFILDNI